MSCPRKNVGNRTGTHAGSLSDLCTRQTAGPVQPQYVVDCHHVGPSHLTLLLVGNKKEQRRVGWGSARPAASAAGLTTLHPMVRGKETRRPSHRNRLSPTVPPEDRRRESTRVIPRHEPRSTRVPEPVKWTGYAVKSDRTLRQVRSDFASSRSNSAEDAKMPNTGHPFAVVVSISAQSWRAPGTRPPGRATRPPCSSGVSGRARASTRPACCPAEAPSSRPPGLASGLCGRRRRRLSCIAYRASIYSAG